MFSAQLIQINECRRYSNDIMVLGEAMGGSSGVPSKFLSFPLNTYFPKLNRASLNNANYAKLQILPEYLYFLICN